MPRGARHDKTQYAAVETTSVGYTAASGWGCAREASHLFHTQFLVDDKAARRVGEQSIVSNWTGGIETHVPRCGGYLSGMRDSAEQGRQGSISWGPGEAAGWIRRVRRHSIGWGAATVPTIRAAMIWPLQGRRVRMGVNSR
jgi:hypothetical protein